LSQPYDPSLADQGQTPAGGQFAEWPNGSASGGQRDGSGAADQPGSDGPALPRICLPAGGGAIDLELEAVSCSKAARCVAAGQYVQDVHGSAPGQAIRPAAAAWDGTAWTVRKLPRLAPGETGQLNGVSCGPAAGCLAVGEYITTVGDVRELADAWNGQIWSSVKVTSLSSVFSDLAGIDCTGASRCLAVGEVTTQRALSALWDGSAWRSENAIDP
jgi:hypothetical protein